jgi:hypothetical protein
MLKRGDSQGPIQVANWLYELSVDLPPSRHLVSDAIFLMFFGLKGKTGIRFGH